MAPRDVSGNWAIFQSNGWRTDVTITQNGDRLSGTAVTSNNVIDEQRSFEMDGVVSDTNFELTITWDAARGRYLGTFQIDETLSGTTFDIQHPESQATWRSEFRKFPPVQNVA